MIRAIVLMLLHINLVCEVCECYSMSIDSSAIRTYQVERRNSLVPSGLPALSPIYKNRKMKLLNYRWKNINNTSEYLLELFAIIDIMMKIK